MEKKFQVTQKQFERFFEVLEERGAKAEEMSTARYNGELCRAAVEAGWMPMNVDDADPRCVTEMAQEIRQYVSGVLEIPKN